jgi:predicted phosphodiesterase
VLAALYDVHGNLPALEAVLGDVDRLGVDEIVCGGDLVAGPLPSECLALLRERGARFLMGNADRFVLERSGEDAWAHERLSEAERAEVAAWPASVELDVDGLGRVLFCHGSPRSDEEILTAATPDDVAAAAVAGADADVVVGGHTHQQYDRIVGDVRLVNAGSVGLPYEGRPGAFWALFGPDVELRRSDYDVRRAADALEATGFPRLREYLVPSLLESISREEVTAQHERNAGRGA